GVIPGITFPHRLLASHRNLGGRLLCSTLELGRRRSAIDNLQQSANSPCSFYDRILIGLAQQDQGIKNVGIAWPVGRRIRITDTQALKESSSIFGDLVDFPA